MAVLPWIALAVAIDSNTKASEANKRSKRTKRSNLKQGFFLVRPVHLEDVHVRETKGFFDSLRTPTKRILAKKPWAELSLRVSDVENLKQLRDDDGNPFVLMRLSEDAVVYDDEGDQYSGLYVPGTLSEVTNVLNLAGGNT